MKRVSILTTLLLVLAMVLVGCGSGGGSTPSPSPSAAATPTPIANPTIRLSTTTSVNDSGLLPYLQPAFEADTGYKLEITSNGTGAAIKLGETGDADCLLVHAKASEEQFVTDGFGVERKPFMHNYFVIAGPKDDPSKVKDAKSAADAFKAIAASGKDFVSRGDDSGTHKAELGIWTKAGIDPAGKKYYVSVGAGMGASLTQANERKAYILTDKATYLSMKENLADLEILLEQSDELKNVYSLIAVNPEKHADTNIDGANAFIEWMTSKKALDLIAEYGKDTYGEALFYVGE